MTASLNTRMIALERANRRLRRICALVLAGVAAMLLVGQAAGGEKVVTARRIVLVDAAGRKVCEIGSSESAAIEFRMRHPQKGGGITLAVRKDGSAGISLRDATDTSRLGLGLHSDGTPGLAMRDKDENVLVALGVATDGDVQLFMAPVGSKTAAGIDLKTNGYANIFLADGDGHKTVKIIRASNGLPGMLVETPSGTIGFGGTAGSVGFFARDTKGRIRAIMGLMKDESPVFFLGDGKGVHRIESIVEAEGARQYLRAEDGRVLWKIPK